MGRPPPSGRCTLFNGRVFLLLDHIRLTLSSDFLTCRLPAGSIPPAYAATQWPASNTPSSETSCLHAQSHISCALKIYNPPCRVVAPRAVCLRENQLSDPRNQYSILSPNEPSVASSPLCELALSLVYRVAGVCRPLNHDMQPFGPARRPHP